MNSRLLPVFALLSAAGIFFGYVNPVWTGPIAAAKASIELDNQALAAAKQYTAQQNDLAAKRNAIDPADLAKLAAFLPDSVDNVGLILDLNALAARSGLSISNIDITTSPAAEGAKSSLPSGVSLTGSVDLSLSAVGTYPSLKSFLAGMERSARLLDVQNISVKGSETGVYTYEIKLRLYWLR